MAKRNMDALARLVERAAETGDSSAAAKAISLRVRRGDLAAGDVELAAMLGHHAARLACGWPDSRVHDAVHALEVKAGQRDVGFLATFFLDGFVKPFLEGNAWLEKMTSLAPDHFSAEALAEWLAALSEIVDVARGVASRLPASVDISGLDLLRSLVVLREDLALSEDALRRAVEVREFRGRGESSAPWSRESRSVYPRNFSHGVPFSAAMWIALSALPHELAFIVRFLLEVGEGTPRWEVGPTSGYRLLRFIALWRVHTPLWRGVLEEHEDEEPRDEEPEEASGGFYALTTENALCTFVESVRDPDPNIVARDWITMRDCEGRAWSGHTSILESWDDPHSGWPAAMRDLAVELLLHARPMFEFE